MEPFEWLCAGIATGVAVGLIVEGIKEASSLDYN